MLSEFKPAHFHYRQVEVKNMHPSFIFIYVGTQFILIILKSSMSSEDPTDFWCTRE